MRDWYPFLGEYELSIDEKNRLLIPSDIRKRLNPQTDGEALILTIGRNNRPWLYPEKFYGELVQQIEQNISPDASAHRFDLKFFARASRVAWDKQGRILLPEKTFRRSQLGKDVVLLGVRDHLELANRSDWEAEDMELAQEMPDRPRTTVPPAPTAANPPGAGPTATGSTVAG